MRPGSAWSPRGTSSARWKSGARFRTTMRTSSRAGRILPREAEAAAAAVAAGNRFYEQGDLARAVAEWEKAAASRPARHRTQGAPRRRARPVGQPQPQAQLPERGSEEAERGNFDEALALCRKALDLDPSDASALLVTKEIEDKGHELAESAASQTASGSEALARRRKSWTPAPKVDKRRFPSGLTSQADSCGPRFPGHHCAGSLVFPHGTFRPCARKTQRRPSRPSTRRCS